MKKLLLSTFAASALLLAGCSDNPEVASTEAGRIREEDLYEAMKNEPLQSGMTVGETVLQRILISDIFEHLYGDTVTDEDVDAEYAASAEQFGGVESYDELLEMQGLDSSYIKDNIRLTLLIREAVRDNVEITDEELQTVYDENQPIATVRHILVGDEELANDLIAQLEDGADFEELVAEHSTDTGSNTTGGVYSLQEGQMVPEFEEASLALEVGEVTAEPVQSDHGYHIIERLELDYASFEDQKADLELQVIDNYVADETYMTELVTRLADEANVQIADQDLLGAMSIYMPEEEAPVEEETTEEESTEDESTDEDATEEETTEEGSEEE